MNRRDLIDWIEDNKSKVFALIIAVLYTGILGRVPISKTTPGCFVVFGWWVLLLLPLVMTILSEIFHWEIANLLTK